MKAIVCEMCGSQDLVKKDGMYVCQNCGTKYDPEEAKKLLVEIRVDNSEKLKNWYQLARRAKDNNDAVSAVQYYDLILQEEPQDWEAAFYKGYFRAMQTKIYYISSAANELSSLVKTVLPMLQAIESVSERKVATIDVCISIATIADLFERNARQTFKSAVDSAYSGQMTYYNEYLERVNAINGLLGTMADGAVAIFPGDKDFQKVFETLYNMALQYLVNVNYGSTIRQSLANDQNIRRIKEWNPSYSPPVPDRTGFPSFFITVLNKNDRKY